ncbi:MAG: ABC transporter permease subunit [Rhodospirillaceae bacterium]|nr:ABC transporter permease subunit [Rhodospirillaceae bacterium]
MDPGHNLIGGWVRDARVRSAAFQTVVAVAAIALVWWLAHNTINNLAQRGITVGFDFLGRAARFPISESVLPYSSVDTFAWAFVVGLGNTLFASALIIVLATLLGFATALARRSRNPLARGIGAAFVETMRNTPLVVQLLFWYAMVTLGLPHPHDALNPLPGVYLTDRGLYIPWPRIADFSFAMEYPTLGRFNYSGGLALTPEFTAMLVGLVFYSAAFVGEIIRGGIDAVARGQWEAGRALGLPESLVLRRIIMPQALRVIIPPMTSQYINIVKNTTLALVVGYPDIAFVTATTINQTGQAVEGILLLMIVFLVISIGGSLLMNWYNRRMALTVR